MNFKEFVELTRPVIGGKGGVQKYVCIMFDAMGVCSEEPQAAQNCAPPGLEVWHVGQILG